MKILKSIVFIFVFSSLSMFYSCSSVTEIENFTFNEFSKGSGFFIYNYTAPNFSKTLRVFYHIPANASTTAPILMVFHGVNRNAKEYRDALVNAANQKNFITIVPEFSDENFPNSNQYNLGNVYENGDNPSSNTLNPSVQWSFSIIEKLFAYVKKQQNNSNNTYNIFGHSAGAQFAHRFLMFVPNNNAEQIVISAAGWYTFPNESVSFPYGISNSILINTSLQTFYSKKIIVQVGEFDNNPLDSNLRHNTFTDAQGLHRLERTTNYFNFCKEQAKNHTFDFNWTFQVQKNSDHNYIKAAQNAANLLFN